ncbi:MAG: amidohydrolase [Anaerolineae bacterium]|nr:amidohydrolase [Anaerolineae bacterium]
MKVQLLHNARIFTGAAIHPWAESAAIVDGKIVALDHAALAWQQAPNVTVEDMRGVLIIPGITDAHIHLMWCARGLRELDLRDLDRRATVEAVAARVRELPNGTWITGRGWDQNIWSDTAFPTAAELDRVAPQHPVALIAKNAHATVANTAAMAAAGITTQTPDPVYGRIARDDRGRPTGVFFEEASGLISRARPEPDFQTLVDLLDESQQSLLAKGITGVHDVDGSPAFAAEQELRRQGRQRIRIVKYVRLEALDGVLAAGLRTGYGNDMLRFGGLKLFADGALGARTAALFDAYVGEPDNVGLLTLDPGQLHEIAHRAVLSGLAIAIHAIGDRANAVALDALESVRDLDPTLRHRVEHVQMIREEDQARLARNGFVASMQPTHAIHDMRMSDRYWGERSRLAYAWRSIREAGATLAFGSDAPIEVFDPFLGLYAAVARRSETDGSPGPEGWYPEQRLTLRHALEAYTIGAAYAAGLEDRLGRLLPGYHADLVVLDHNIFTLPPEALLETHVSRVMVGGVWQALP